MQHLSTHEYTCTDVRVIVTVTEAFVLTSSRNCCAKVTVCT